MQSFLIIMQACRQISCTTLQKDHLTTEYSSKVGLRSDTVSHKREVTTGTLTMKVHDLLSSVA